MQLPKRVTVELTNNCNRTCKGCPRLKTNYPPGNMDWRLYTRILRQLPDNTTIVPFFRGEATLHPKFPQAMRKLRRFEKVQVATNGDKLDVATRQAMTENCTFVSVSLHSFTYPRNKHQVVKLFKECNDAEVDTQVSILESLLPSDVDGFTRSWLKHVNNVRIYKEHSHIGFGDVPFDGGFDSSAGLPCVKPFEEMAVYWDGKVALCNHDWNSKGLGNLNYTLIRDVWESEAYNLIREMHNNSLRKRVESCKDCSYWATSYIPNKRFGQLFTRDEVIDVRS